MNFLWIHIPYVLLIVVSIYGLPHTDKLSGLFNNIAYIPALADSEKLSIGDCRTVHDDGCHCAHTVLPFPARLTLDQPRQEFSLGISHTHHLIF